MGEVENIHRQPQPEPRSQTLNSNAESVGKSPTHKPHLKKRKRRNRKRNNTKDPVDHSPTTSANHNNNSSMSCNNKPQKLQPPASLHSVDQKEKETTDNVDANQTSKHIPTAGKEDKDGATVEDDKDNATASKIDPIDRIDSNNLLDTNGSQISQKPLLELPHLQSPNLELEMPVNSFETSPSNSMSPRRQAIMRYKKSDDKINNGSIINKVKGSLKSSNSTENELDPNQSLKPPHVDEKISLFKFKSSRILVFDEVIDESETEEKPRSGRLLGHGEFEIFQLHNGDVTYLACGTSFIYPLLPKLKILRIAFNHFILPLVNPDRYWKILINTDDNKVIQDLEAKLEMVVQYRNLAIGVRPPANSSAISPIQASLKLPDTPNPSNDNDIIKDNSNNTLLDFNLGQISNDIPDTPPSAPLSPHNERPGILDTFQLDGPLKPPVINAELHHMDTMLPRDNSNKSISSALASFDVRDIEDSKILKKYLHANPYQKPLTKLSARYQKTSTKADDKSDSSMDSLLDEYEESMSVSKSFTYTRSRAQSRAPSRPMSRTSSFIQPPVNYTRGKYFPGNIVDNDFEHDNPDLNHNQSFNSKASDVDLFPITSLSEYNKTHNIRSRRSSRSELYTSESNWMEPNPNSGPDHNRMPHSRSSYSVSSQYQNHDLRNSDLNSTYKQIYKSITQRNISQLTSDKNDDLKSTRSYQRLPTIEQSKAFNYRQNKYLTSSVRNDYNHPRYGNDRSKQQTHKALEQSSTSASRLNSDELYKMISSKRTSSSERSSSTTRNSMPRSSLNLQSYPQRASQPQEKKGFASRLFGW